LLDRQQALALYEQVAKDEKIVKEVINKLKIYPMYVQSIETLDMIWDSLLQAANDFHMAVIRNPMSDQLTGKASLVRYLKNIFFDNIVYRKIYRNSGFLPDLSVYTY
jgi:hypothetical protein